MKYVKWLLLAILERLSRRDDLRRTYYKKYTGSEIDSASNYNICLDVGTLGVDRCVQILLEILK